MGIMRLAQLLVVGSADELFRVERLQERACAASREGQFVAETLRSAPRSRVLIVGPLYNGIGNEFDTILHGYALAMVSNRSLCVLRGASSTLELLEEPRTVGWGSCNFDKFETCSVLPQAVACVQQRAAVVHMLPKLQWIPETFTHKVDKLARDLLEKRSGGRYRWLLGCLASRVIRPGPLLREHMTPFLTQFRDADLALSVHVRTSDNYMVNTQREGLVGEDRHLPPELMTAHDRGGCVSIKGVRSHFVAALGRCFRQQLTRAVLFVGSDRDDWLMSTNDLGGLKVLTTAGHPVHTAINTTNKTQGLVKALVDFFLLAEADFYVSNCKLKTCAQLLTPFCQNTFAYNAYVRRLPSLLDLDSSNEDAGNLNVGGGFFNHEPPNRTDAGCPQALVDARGRITHLLDSAPPRRLGW